MQRVPLITKDGSHTISIPEMNVIYHSIHGAIQESMHVFIDAGLNPLMNRPGPLHILEFGFGTALNALLTLIESEKKEIIYTAIERFPLRVDEASRLNYCSQLGRPELEQLFISLHACKWETFETITRFFILRKTNCSLMDFNTDELQDIVFFDAFAPAVQPELWTNAVFEKIYTLMNRGSVLVTYCSKGDVRRSMQAAGFNVEKIPGPPGKREMLRAIKK